jgi:hypothetical protein
MGTAAGVDAAFAVVWILVDGIDHPKTRCGVVD